jgi:predicted Zn-dependent peptidase
MMAQSRFFQETLPNGLVVVTEVMPDVRSAACGFLVRTGARDDPPELAGLSHFLEHMCFKGTARRSAEQINIGFDEIGADNNAQTSKDQTFYYSWGRTDDLPTHLDLLADMMRSTLPPEELETERGVILEEIASYKDDLSSDAYDFLYETICPGHPLSWPVLGYDRTVTSMRPQDLRRYLDRRYAPANMALIVAGNVNPRDIHDLAIRHCGQWENADSSARDRRPPTLRTGTAVQQIDRFHQQVVILAFPSACGIHKLDETAEAVTAILGGPNSRFFWNIYQKGLATRISAVRDEYVDSGLLILFALCEPENAERVLAAMRREAQDLSRNGPEPKEIQRVKNHRRTMLATESEAPGYRLGQIADDVDYLGAPRPAEARLAEVDAVSTETIQEYFREFPVTGEGFLVSVGPRPWPATG